MSADASPYESPKAGYAGKSNHIIYEDPLPLSLSQRLNRLRYSCYQLTMVVVVLLVMVLGALLYQAAGGEQSPWAYMTAIIGAVFLGLGATFYSIVLMVRRLHDLGRSGWLVLWLLAPLVANLLPLVGIVLSWLPLLAQLVQAGIMLYLLAGESAPGMNSYGTPSPPNGILVTVFGGLWWIFSVLSLLLSIAFMVFVVFAPQLLPTGLLEQMDVLDFSEWPRTR